MLGREDPMSRTFLIDLVNKVLRNCVFEPVCSKKNIFEESPDRQKRRKKQTDERRIHVCCPLCLLMVTTCGIWRGFLPLPAYFRSPAGVHSQATTGASSGNSELYFWTRVNIVSSVACDVMESIGSPILSTKMMKGLGKLLKNHLIIFKSFSKNQKIFPSDVITCIVSTAHLLLSRFSTIKILLLFGTNTSPQEAPLDPKTKF